MRFTRKPAKILGRVAKNLSALKKTLWNRGQPGELTMTQPTSPNTRTVLMVATSTATPRDRQGDRRGAEGWSGAGRPGTMFTTDRLTDAHWKVGIACPILIH